MNSISFFFSLFSVSNGSPDDFCCYRRKNYKKHRQSLIGCQIDWSYRKFADFFSNFFPLSLSLSFEYGKIIQKILSKIPFVLLIFSSSQGKNQVQANVKLARKLLMIVQKSMFSLQLLWSMPITYVIMFRNV